MKKPGNHRKINTILILIVLASGIALLGVRARWVAARTNPAAVAATAAQGCTLNCSATVPATGTINTAVQFTGSATASGCSTQPSFSWDFGDGSPDSSQQNPTHTYTTAGTYSWTLTTSSGSGGLVIDTIAGGLGEGAPARQAPFGTIVAIARDPGGRGVYVADATNNATLIRFINTSASAVMLGLRTIAPGTIRAIAGGGGDFTTDNISAFQADVGSLSGLAVSPDGNLVYYNDKVGGLVRAVNVSTGAVNVRGQSTGAGNVRTLALSDDFPQFPDLFGLTTNPTNGDVFVIDSIVNKVYRITSNGTVNAFAGNGATTTANDPFPAGTPSATGIPLLQPRAVKSDSAGNIYIADTGHRRVIRVSGGSATLVRQFDLIGSIGNPHPVGIAIVGANVYVANGNEQAIYRANNNGPKIAGILSGGDPAACDYSSNSCGDGGPTINAGFNMLGSSDDPPLAGLEGDNEGLYVADQKGKGRVRFINLVSGTVTRAGLQIATNTINTIAGSGRPAPFDGGLAIGAALNAPTGVALDGVGNLWISDTNTDAIRFVNRGSNAVTIFNGTSSAQTVPAGSIVTVNNVGGPSGDNVAVNQATFDSPQGLFVTSQGVYVVDSNGGDRVPADINGEDTSLLKFINTTSSPVTIFSGAGGSAITVPPGNIAVIAGGSSSGASTGFARNVTLKGASDVAVAANGTIYITDVRNRAVRRVDASTGNVSALNLPASKEYTGLGFTSDARLLVANFTDGSVHRESSAGSGTFAIFGGTGGNLQSVRDVVGGSGGNVFATIGPASPSSGNHRIVQILATGSTAVIAGGLPGFDGDGGAAVAGRLNTSPPRLVLKSIPPNVTVPETVNIAIGQNGEIIFTDTNNHRIRQISGAISTCVRTGTITIAGNNPVPVLTSLDPNSRLNNSGAFTLKALGSNFAPSSVVRWNGAPRTTTFISPTELNASIPATDLATAGGAGGTALVTVFTPAPGGGTSGALTFNIIGNNPVPSITSLSPNSRTEGSPGFTLTVNGTGFINGSVVRWDGSPRTTTFESSTRLTAQIDANDLIGVGQVSVTVFNPTPGGGVSNSATFDVIQPNNPIPVLTGISPNSVNAGAGPFTLTANGSSFSLSSKVRWNGQELETAFVSAAQLTAQVTANLVANPGTAQVTVFTPTPGGGTSAAQTFTINQARPPSVLRVSNSGGAPGSTISVPVELVSQGDENAMGFSLSYPAATLTHTQTVLGADATSAQLNVNTSQTAQGRLGITLALSAGQRFTAGVRQVVVVSFTIAANAPGGTVSIDFGDQPIVREVADVTAGTLQANYVSGVVTITQGFEADVNPRPNGNGSLTISDWVLLGRFAAGLDTVAAGSEFQRADCAPRNTLGNGSITLSDWVQAGRYAAGLDPVTPAGGPTGPPSNLSAVGGGQLHATAKEQGAAARAIRALASSGEPNTMTVYLNARGDESAIGFSLQYDPARARFAGAELGAELGPSSGNATLLVNIRKLESGRVGLMLALPAGQSFRAGEVALLTVRFTLAPGGTPNQTRVSFGDEPITRAAVDVNAQTAEAVWADADLAVNARMAVSVSAANFTAGFLAPETIVAAFADGLATTTQSASSLPLPLELMGTRVVARDSAGVERPAPLFFISASQINYLMPAETAPGQATVMITSGDGTVFIQMVEIEPLAPGLFTANADGHGVAAAVALRVSADGSMSYEPVAQFDGAQGRFVAAPVDLGDEGDQVYLILFGTGIGSAAAPGAIDSVKATIGGIDARVTYAGAQGGFAGLAQINLLLPRSLAGRGMMDLNFTVNGRGANTVKVDVR